MADQDSTAGQADAAPKVAPASNSALPLFYGHPVPLSPRRHGDKSISDTITFEFAQNHNSVPINAMEFPQASRQYPIVFTASTPVAPVAVFGLKEGQNFFVGDDGKWLDAAYVPAYVRRYPFIFMTSGDRQKFTLCIDEDSRFLVTDGGKALFNGDEPAQAVQDALEFCKAFQGHFDATSEFCAELAAQDLLVTHRADVTLVSGKKLGLAGFRVVDEVKFNALPDEVILAWRKRGWLPAIYAHLISQNNWSNLVRLATLQEAEGNTE